MLPGRVQQCSSGQENAPQQVSIKFNTAPHPIHLPPSARATPKQTSTRSSGAFIIAVSGLTTRSVLVLQS